MMLTIPASCTESGVITYICSECGATKTEVLPALRHIDADHDGICDRCGEQIGESGETPNPNACKYCGKDHSGSFIQRFVGFFHKIAYFFAHLFGKM